MLELRLDPFPVLGTERLRLRELRDDDVEALFALRSDPRVMRHIARPLADSRQDAIDLIERVHAERAKNDGITWVMELNDAPGLIGTIGYYRTRKEHFRGEVGYAMAHAYWGKGLMSEALRAVLEHGFSALGFHSIMAVTDPVNTASIGLLERIGFVQEGLFRQDFLFNGTFQDSAVFSLLCPEAR